MGHAGAIISGSKGTAQAKMDALAAAGVHVCLNPTEAGQKWARSSRRSRGWTTFDSVSWCPAWAPSWRP